MSEIQIHSYLLFPLLSTFISAFLLKIILKKHEISELNFLKKIVIGIISWSVLYFFELLFKNQTLMIIFDNLQFISDFNQFQ